ncbi:hypothetical protein NHX12_020662, partial [Muraenolepis orangiensis]
MSARGEEAGEPSGSQELEAEAEPPKRKPGRPRKPQKVFADEPRDTWTVDRPFGLPSRCLVTWFIAPLHVLVCSPTPLGSTPLWSQEPT